METYCSIEEAWGDPDIQYSADDSDPSNEPTLTFQEMHNLPGYADMFGGACQPTKVSVPQRQPVAEKKKKEVQEPDEKTLSDRFLPTALDADSQAHILNSLLYIVSGIYLIYTMDMFMRMGMHMKQ